MEMIILDGTAQTKRKSVEMEEKKKIFSGTKENRCRTH